MIPQHHTGAPRGRRDFIDVQVGRIRSQDARRLGDRVDFGEDLLLERHAFEHRLHDDVRILKTGVAQLRRDPGHALVHRSLREPALLHAARIVLADGRHSAIERLLAGLLDDHRNSGIRVRHRDAAAHRARADHRRATDFPRLNVRGNTGNLRDRALRKEGVDQRLALRGVQALAKQFRFQRASFVERKARRGLHRFNRRQRSRLAALRLLCLLPRRRENRRIAVAQPGVALAGPGRRHVERLPAQTRSRPRAGRLR